MFGESPHGDAVDGAGSGGSGNGGGGVAILDVGAGVHESKSRSISGSPSLLASPSVSSVGSGVGDSGSSEIPPGSPLWPADATGSSDSSSSSGSTNVNAQRARALQALVDTLQMQRMEAETGAGKAAVQRVVDEAATNNARLEDAWSERSSPFVVQSVFCIQSGERIDGGKAPFLRAVLGVTGHDSKPKQWPPEIRQFMLKWLLKPQY